MKNKIVYRNRYEHEKIQWTHKRHTKTQNHVVIHTYRKYNIQILTQFTNTSHHTHEKLNITEQF